MSRVLLGHIASREWNNYAGLGFCWGILRHVYRIIMSEFCWGILRHVNKIYMSRVLLGHIESGDVFLTNRRQARIVDG